MSLRARIFCSIVRRQVSRNRGGSFDLQRMRAMFETTRIPVPLGISVQRATLGGVPGEWVCSTRSRSEQRLLYIHGGGFVACSPRSHRPVTGAFARRGFDVFVPDYRLAPEHPFPAGLDDVVAAWKALSATGSAAVAGDSAGGNLALGLIQCVRSSSLPMPCAAALFSPATDMTGSGTSFVTNAKRDPVLNSDALKLLLPLYLGATNPLNPLVSPLYANLSGFPPLLLHVGEREILRDDSVRLAERAKLAGVKVQLRVFPIVPHVWQIAQGFLPEARQSIDAAALFLRRYS